MFAPGTLVLLNFSATPLDVEPTDQRFRTLFRSLRKPTDLLSGSPVRLQPRDGSIRVAANSALIVNMKEADSG